MINKIKSLNNIENIIKLEKSKNKKIILCHGVFDLVHYGHILHFNSAKKLGDILIVSVTPSRYIEKGTGRPYYNDIQRLNFLANLNMIDYVVLNSGNNALDIIRKTKPHFYCKGADYKKIKNDITGEIKREINQVKKYNGKIKITDEVTFSSSKILNDLGGILNEGQLFFLKKLKKNFNKKKIENFFSKLKKLDILIVGEIIIDRYIFNESIGKSGKEHYLVTREINKELYLGGSGAIANHLSDFCKKVTLISSIGEKKEYLKFIKNKISKNVRLKLINKKNSPTIEKTRYIDIVSNTKLLGIHNLNDQTINGDEEKKITNLLQKNIKKSKPIIVSDYGHGLVTNKIAKLICKTSSFLALNSQLNAFNSSHHSINKYKNIDFLIINESELRHEMRDKYSKVETLTKKISISLNIKQIVVTRGRNGSVHFSRKKNKFIYCPAFASKVVDKVGAGDAMLSIMSILISAGLEVQMSMFFGALAAAQNVETINNSEKINKTKLLKYAIHMLQ